MSGNSESSLTSESEVTSQPQKTTHAAICVSQPRNDEDDLSGYHYWSAMAGPNHEHLLIPRTKRDSVHRFIFGLRSDIRERMLGQLESPWEVMIGEAFRVERYVEVIHQVLAHEKSGTQIPNELREQMRIIPVGELERERIRANEDDKAVGVPPYRNDEDDLSGYHYWSAMAGPNHEHLLIPRTKRDNVHRFIFGLRSDIRERMLGQLENPWEVMIGAAFHVERYVEVIHQVLAHEKSGTQIPNELQDQMRIIPVGELERERTRANEDDNLAGYQYWSAMAGPNHHHLLNPQTKRDSVHRFIFGLRSNIRVRMLRHLESPWEVMIAEALRVEKYVIVIQQVLDHEKAGTQIPRNLRKQMRIIPVGELERERARAI